jgi:hypothetical protein
MAKTGTGALAVTPAGVMTAPAPAPGAGAERNGGLKVYWIASKEVKEGIESGRLRFSTEYDALRALIVSDVIRVLEVRAGGATAYVVVFLEDDDYHYASSAEEALRIAVGDTSGVILMERHEIEMLAKKAVKRAR